MYKGVMLVALLVFVNMAQAITQINISIINRKGIDNNLVLTNEHHSANLYEPEKTVVVSMKNGIKVEFNLLEKEKEGVKFFVIDGEVTDNGRLVSKLIDGRNDHLYFEKEKKYILYDKNEQVIEVRITALDIVSKKK